MVVTSVTTESTNKSNYSQSRLIWIKNTRRFSFEFCADTNYARVLNIGPVATQYTDPNSSLLDIWARCPCKRGSTVVIVVCKYLISSSGPSLYMAPRDFASSIPAIDKHSHYLSVWVDKRNIVFIRIEATQCEGKVLSRCLFSKKIRVNFYRCCRQW